MHKCSNVQTHTGTPMHRYMEIYNDGIYDLLNSDALPVDAITGAVQGDPTLRLQEDQDGNCHVKGLTKRLVHSEESALEFLYDGELNRAVAEHRLNAGSTRSHCILTMVRNQWVHPTQTASRNGTGTRLVLQYRRGW